jgi:hypothetical protein
VSRLRPSHLTLFSHGKPRAQASFATVELVMKIAKNCWSFFFTLVVSAGALAQSGSHNTVLPHGSNPHPVETDQLPAPTPSSANMRNEVPIPPADGGGIGSHVPTLPLGPADIAGHLVPSLEIDATTAQPYGPADTIQFSWLLHNTTQISLTGALALSVDGRAVTASFPKVQDLQMRATLTGVFKTGPLVAGAHTIMLRFNRFMGLKQTPAVRGELPGIVPVYETIATASRDITVVGPAIDSDGDGIEDRVEDVLLERFRPYFKFSKQNGHDDDNRPTDVLWYLERSELLTTGDEDASPVIDNSVFRNRPAAVVFKEGNSSWFTTYGPSDLTAHGVRSEYRVNPLEKLPWASGDNLGRRGPEWPTVVAKKNIGLYGHVVPIRLSGPKAYDRYHVPSPQDSGDLYYKIEYWQFFGFNDDDIGMAGCHEGDWITVQLLYNPRSDAIETVWHYEHGKIETTFNINGSSGPFDVSLPGSTEHFVEYKGRNYGDYGDIGAIKDNYSDNTLLFCQDPVTQKFTHPVAYIEWGAHEPWPTRAGFYPGVPNHDGNSYSYLVATPPNVGEVGKPSNAPGAIEVLHYNGHWGALGDGPPGPPLHWQWTWPLNSVQYRPEQQAFTN